MRKLPDFKNHNCYCEQKIAYNFLFSYAHINECPLNVILGLFNGSDAYVKKFEKYDLEAIKNCILKNYEQYVNKPFIASSYKEISEQLPL